MQCQRQRCERGAKQNSDVILRSARSARLEGWKHAPSLLPPFETVARKRHSRRSAAAFFPTKNGGRRPPMLLRVTPLFMARVICNGRRCGPDRQGATWRRDRPAGAGRKNIRPDSRIKRTIVRAANRRSWLEDRPSALARGLSFFARRSQPLTFSGSRKFGWLPRSRRAPSECGSKRRGRQGRHGE